MPGGAVVLEIAGLRLRVGAEGALTLGPPDPAYRAFLRGADDGRRADVEMTVTAAPARVPRDAEVRFETGDAWRLLARDGRRLVVLHPPGHDRPLWVADTDADWARVRVHCGAPLVDRTSAPPTIRRAIQYPLDQIVVVNALASRGGLLVHAAGLVRDGAAILFPGRSGAGKSTFSRLLRGAATDLLSDDRVLLRDAGGGMEAHGTPWPGEAGIASRGSAPLRALAFLAQSSDTGIAPLAPRDALPRLLQVASVPWYEPAAAAAALDTCDRVLRGVPAFELRFGPTAGSVGDALEALDRAA